MDLTIHKRKFICVEYPGVVKDEEKMLKTLGGEENINQVFNTTGQRLELRYRPDDIYCKPTCANKYNTASLLLKVRHIKKTDQSGQTHSEYTGEVLGIINGVYKFTNLVDFQYLPVMRASSSESGYQSLRDDLCLDKIRPLSWIDRSVPLHLPPTLFSRIDNPSEYYYKDGVNSLDKIKGTSSNPNVISVSRHRRPHYTQIVQFENWQVPKEPHPQAIRKVNNKKKVPEVYKKIKQMFSKRPVWTRMALLMNLDQHQEYLKIILPSIAYYVLTGPWRRVWVRFGYDPRSDPNAKIYQVVDFRIKDKKLSEALGISIKRSSTSYKLPNKMTKIQTTTPKIKQSELRAGASNTVTGGMSQAEKDAHYKFYPGLIPAYHQICYQFCDLIEDRIQKLIHSNDGKEKECTEKDGWCLPNTTENIRKIILDHLLELANKNQNTIKGKMLHSDNTSSYGTERNPVPSTSHSKSVAKDPANQDKGSDHVTTSEMMDEDEDDLNTEEEELMEEASSDDEDEDAMDDG